MSAYPPAMPDLPVGARGIVGLEAVDLHGEALIRVLIERRKPCVEVSGVLIRGLVHVVHELPRLRAASACTEFSCCCSLGLQLTHADGLRLKRQVSAADARVVQRALGASSAAADRVRWSNSLPSAAISASI